MRNRRGFALLTVLWLIAVLSALAGSGLLAARLGADASRNRLTLRRAAWAREACVAILSARYEAAAPMRGLDSVDLGRGVWCRATVFEPAARLHLNLATAEQLQRLFGDAALVDAVLDWRDADTTVRPQGAEGETYAGLGRSPPRNGPFADVQELRLVRGFENVSLDWLEARLTVRGDGSIDVNSATAEVLTSLGLFDASEIERIVAARTSGRALQSLDQLLARTDPTRREVLVSSLRDFGSALAFAPREMIVEVEGGVASSPLRARGTLTTVPLPNRLAVVRREVW